MAYKIRGVVRLDNSGNANLGIASATEFDGKVSDKAITEQTDGGAGDVTGADELLLYDTNTGDLLRVTVDEFVRGSGIGTIVSDFDNLNVNGITTVGFLTATDAWVGGAVTVGGNILPDADITYDIGSPTNRFKDIYLSGSTLYLDTDTLGSAFGNLQFNGEQVLIKSGEDISLTGDINAVRNINSSGIVTANQFFGSGANLTDVATSLGSLSDVDLTGVGDGQVIVYDQANTEWVPGVGPSFTLDSNRNVYAAELIGTPSFTTGADNTIVGNGAGANITSGSKNVVLGESAGANITEGTNNIVIGSSALGTNASTANFTGNDNIILGSLTGSEIRLDESIILGYEVGIAAGNNGPALVIGSKNLPTETNSWIEGNSDGNIAFGGSVIVAGTFESKSVNRGVQLQATKVDSSGTLIEPVELAYVVSAYKYSVNPNNSAIATRTETYDFGSVGTVCMTEYTVSVRDTDTGRGMVDTRKVFYNGSSFSLENGNFGQAVTASYNPENFHDIIYSTSGTSVTVNIDKGPSGGGGGRAATVDIITRRYLRAAS